MGHLRKNLERTLWVRQYCWRKKSVKHVALVNIKYPIVYAQVSTTNLSSRSISSHTHRIHIWYMTYLRTFWKSTKCMSKYTIIYHIHTSYTDLYMRYIWTKSPEFLVSKGCLPLLQVSSICFPCSRKRSATLGFGFFLAANTQRMNPQWVRGCRFGPESSRQTLEKNNII